MAARGLEDLLSEDERDRAARLRFERDRRRFVVARARLRELLGRRLGMRPEAVAIVYGAQGKPALARGELRFNLAHSGELALYAFSRACEVGVDLEEIRALPEARPGFLRRWTRREALAKGLGSGLAAPWPGRGALAGWRIESFRPAPGFIAALASKELE